MVLISTEEFRTVGGVSIAFDRRLGAVLDDLTRHCEG